MIVVNQNVGEYIIQIIPRYYPQGDIIFTLYNEATQVSQVIENTYEIIDGNMFVSFLYNSFEDNDKFQVKIEEENEVVYRGKMIATSQNPQEYKLTDNVYYY